MFDFEKKFLDFCLKKYKIIFIIFITFAALLVRYYMRDFMSGDYTVFLSNWFDYLKNNGGLKALATYPGDYNAPYMTIMAILTYLPFNKLYMIKGISIVFDFVLAFYSGKLVSLLVKKNNDILFIITYSVILFLPNVMINGGMWGQCDVIYSAFLVMAMYYFMKDKITISFVMLGLSFAFKLQFIFILPAFIILYCSKKNFSILNFFIIPLVDLVLCLPSIIAGKSLLSCMMVYFNQTNTYSYSLVLNFPNIYNLLNGNVEMFSKIGMITTVVVFAIICFYIVSKNVKWNNEKVFRLCILSIVLATYLLPSMHERYLFAGEILSVIYYIVYRKNGILTFVINLFALLTYSRFIFGLDFDYMKFLSITYTVIVLKYSIDTLCFIGGNNEKYKKYI